MLISSFYKRGYPQNVLYFNYFTALLTSKNKFKQLHYISCSEDNIYYDLCRKKIIRTVIGEILLLQIIFVIR